MLEMDGFYLYQAYPYDERAAVRNKLPIIAMTAHAMLGDEEKSLAHGMNAHLTKPLNVEVLSICLQKYIGADGNAV